MRAVRIRIDLQGFRFRGALEFKRAMTKNSIFCMLRPVLIEVCTCNTTRTETVGVFLFSKIQKETRFASWCMRYLSRRTLLRAFGRMYARSLWPNIKTQSLVKQLVIITNIGRTTPILPNYLVSSRKYSNVGMAPPPTDNSSGIPTAVDESTIKKNQPIVISGPSGAGKSTILRRLFDEFPGKFGFSISRKYQLGPVFYLLA